VTRLLGTAVRRAQTGNVQTYVSALLAGSLVLASRRCVRGRLGPARPASAPQAPQPCAARFSSAS
ncbi:hypothetical protein AB0L02_37130, partial [Streptomyces anulatus]|uniref:hypothetical protein n=1 Tax=Streptomyces anulatus TaxID=1892 RepID=UPI00342E2ACF